MKASTMKDAPKTGEHILIKYTNFGWHPAYWNGGAWIPPREGTLICWKPMTTNREIQKSILE